MGGGGDLVFFLWGGKCRFIFMGAGIFLIWELADSAVADPAAQDNDKRNKRDNYIHGNSQEKVSAEIRGESSGQSPG